MFFKVQNVPGEDKCVIMLGYTHQMEEMMRDSNPGLKRRYRQNRQSVLLVRSARGGRESKMVPHISSNWTTYEWNSSQKSVVKKKQYNNILFFARFQLEDAFNFEDYNDEDLLSILDGKMKKQELEADIEARLAAVQVLARERDKPNFGNGGVCVCVYL